MNRNARWVVLLILTFLGGSVAAFQPNPSSKLELDVQKAILDIQQKDPTIQGFFDHSAGYVVFPGVGKGGWIIGGAYGKGLVIVNDRVEGYSTLSSITVGAQIGGQKFAQFIFFMDTTALNNYKRGNYEFGAQASAVAVTKGAAVTTDYNNGVAVFINAIGGLMAEATVGGQKFTYEPKSPD